MRRTIEITNLNGDTGIGVVSSQLPMDLDYLAFYLVNEGAALVVADMPDFKLIMNSDLVRNYEGTLQDNMNQGDLLDAFAVDQIMPIHLDQLGMKAISATYGTTMNTLSPDPSTGNTITKARIQLKTQGAASPTWRLFADVDDSGNGGPGFVERIQTYGANNIGTSEKSYATVLPFGTFDVRFWRRIFVHNLSGATTVTLARLLKGKARNEIHKRTRPLDLRILADYRQRALFGDINYLIDGTETGIAESFDTMMRNRFFKPDNGSERMITVGQMDLRLTGDAAGLVDLTLDTLGEL